MLYIIFGACDEIVHPTQIELKHENNARLSFAFYEERELEIAVERLAVSLNEIGYQ